MLPRAFVGGAVALAVAASPAGARASACCGTGHGVGQWLGPWERAAASLAIRASERFGAWTSQRDFALPADGNYDRELGAEIGWMARASRRVQLGAVVPVMATWKRLGGASSSGGGAGDVQVTGRVELFQGSLPAWAPSIALTLAATLPTGRPARASDDPLAADVTGLGVAELRPGVVVEETWEGLQATLAASLGFRSGFVASTGEAIELAPRLQVLAAAGPTWPSGVSLAAGALYEREAGARVGGLAAPGSTRERAALLAVLAYDVTTRWTAIGSLQVDVPISGLGRNEAAAVVPSAGVRYVWGRYD